ncbi:18797_t:CDS:2, partial [Racocetra persica]
YFSKIKADFIPHLEENNIKELTTWSQLEYTTRESWILDIVEEYLKQKLIDRADNFKQRNKKTNLQVESNIQVASNDDLEILSQINETEKYNHTNKENISRSKQLTASNSNFSSFIKHTSGNNMTNYKYVDSTSNIESDAISSSDEEINKNVFSQSYQ